MDTAYYLAAGCVALYAHQRFTTPALRSTTTAVQYHLAWIGYITASTGLLTLLSWALQTPAARKFVEQLLNSPLPGELGAPYVAALMLTMLLPSIPVLRRLDAGIQQFFRDLGGIPYKALGLSWRLRRAHFRAPERIRDEVDRRLREQGLDPERTLQSPADSLEAAWIRIVVLVAQTEQALESNAWPRFARNQEPAYEEIQKKYARQSKLAGFVFRAGDDALPLSERELHDDLRAFLKEVTDFISRGMLQSEYTLGRACRRLEEWGFEGLGSDAGRPSIATALNQWVGLTLALFVWMAFFFVILGDRLIDGRLLSMATAIALILGSAVACAIVPKCLLPGLTTRKHLGTRPYAFYVLAAILAAAGWFGIHLARLALEGMPVDEGAAELSQKLGWILLPATAAFATAWLGDNEPGRWRVPEPSVAWLEGVAQAAALALAAYVAHGWLVQAGSPPPTPLPYLVAGAAIIGFIMGFTVPGTYRHVLAEKRAANDGDFVAEPHATAPQTNAMVRAA